METENLIGIFLNTLVLRVEIEDEQSFRALLARVREACLGAYAHQDLPFERLVEELNPARDLSRTPLFQVLLVLQNAPREAKTLAGPAWRGVAADNDTAKFDLTLTLAETPRGLVGGLEYAADLFDAVTIERMIGHLGVLLEGVVASPERRLFELPLLPSREREQAVVEWNDTAAAYPEDTCVHELFEAQVVRTPDAAAVGSDGRELTYRELDLRSNRLAHHLRRRGVGVESRVGLCVERSVDMMVGLLGILKAGGAYVPMDPTYPRGRLAFMASDAGLAALVTEEAVAGVVVAPGAAVVRLDADRAAIDAEEDAPLGRHAGPGSLAYVIYTSGSTGTPKGVEVVHRGVVNFLAAMRTRPGLEATDRLVAVTSLSFDIAGLELLLPLTVGARVEIASRDVVLDGAALGVLLERTAATVMQATPSTWRLLLEAAPGLGARRGVLKALVGGEAVPRDLVDALATQAASVWNMYGPTETTIWSTVHRLGEGERVLIGRPIANTGVYVLDASLSPVPVGVPGELYISGDGLARGYLNRPELTAAGFVPAPFGAPGARMYRTGDRARWLASGALECLGRVDAQVKVRGYRIELGEIEAEIAAYSGVREVAVQVTEDALRGKRLVAYIVSVDAGQPPSAAVLRAHLKERLPDYMVPSAFVALACLPLTPNGKLDRKSLPAPGNVSQGTKTAVAPRDDIEAQLAAVWRRVLGLETVGVTDSFFDLGGHSMLAVRMLADVKRGLGRTVPVVALFQVQTIEQLAQLLRDGDERRWSTLVPIKPTGSSTPLFLVSRPNVNSLGYLALAKSLDPEQPVYGLQYQYTEEAELGRPYSLDEYQTWAATYIQILRSIQPEGPYLLGGMCEGALIAFQMARQLEEQGQEVVLLAMMDAWPEENTRSRFFTQALTWDKRLRFLLRASWRERLAVVQQLTKRVLGRVATSPPADPSSAAQLYMQRVFPGPGFVPSKVTCPITVFRVKEQPYWRIRDEHLGWRDRTTQGVQVHLVPGDHLTFLRDPHVKALGRALDSCLRRATAGLTPRRSK